MVAGPDLTGNAGRQFLGCQLRRFRAAEQLSLQGNGDGMGCVKPEPAMLCGDDASSEKGRFDDEGVGHEVSFL